ncbi:MAG: FKBP-type peptidyl-prolyl cis-trans isomerase [Coriobacteriales bacterium]|nr:FKBP-type peptidyl-prolyl cis-trans isomerase [Coriobacteriales bacterium]
MRDTARSGKTALVHYRGGAQGEKIVEDYTQGEPVRIVLGAGEVPFGIEEALYEMEIGTSQTLVVPPEEAYGFHDPDGLQRYPRSFVGGSEDLEQGDVFAWVNPASGRQIPVRVVEATPDSITCDFNHPLAGKTLEYWIELVDIV